MKAKIMITFEYELIPLDFDEGIAPAEMLAIDMH